MTDQHTDLQQAPRLRAPQRPLHVFLLTFFSFGLYTTVFLYQNGRDLKQLDKQATRPWLWPLAAIVAIALPFLLPKMMQRYQLLGEQAGKNIKNHGAIFGLLIVITSIASELADRFSETISLLALILYLITIASCFAALTSEINKLRDTFPENNLRATPYKLTIAQWITLFIGGAFFCLITAYLLFSTLRFSSMDTWSGGSVWQSPSGDYSITFADEWHQAEPGTFGEEWDNEAEFALSEDSYIRLIRHESGISQQAVSDLRREGIKEAVPNAMCSEERHLLSGTMTVFSQLECSAKDILGEYSYFVAQLDDGHSHIELYAEVLESQQVTHRQSKAKIRRLIDNFRLTGPERN